ncbi:MAG: AsmA-like C-terminal region-containing protein [Deltaproteobacteria bacterium]|nr:AsmA-like C-terminal region-containing protein [Deltaproteobacteria bacterium]
MPVKKLKAVLLPCLLLFLLFVSIILLLNSLLHKPSVQQYIIKQISQSVGYELRAGDIEISFWGGIGISVTDFGAKSMSGDERITAPMVRFLFDPAGLFKRQILLTSIFLSMPVIELPAPVFLSSHTAANGDDSEFYGIIVQKMARLPAVSLERGEIVIKDYPFRVESLCLDIPRQSIDHAGFYFRSRGEIAFGSENAAFKLKGSIAQEDSGNAASVDLKFEAAMIPASVIPPTHYIHGYSGLLNTEFDINGVLGRPLSIKGNVTASNPAFSVANQEIEKKYSFNFLRFDFDSLFSKSEIKVSSFNLNSNDIILKGEAFLNIKDRANPYIDLEVDSGCMSSQSLKNAFPTPFIPEFIEDRIFPLFSGGNINTVQFFLKGTKNMISNLGLAENAGALFLRISGENLEVFKDSDVMPVKILSGELVINDGVLTVSDLKAKFGSSHMDEASLHVGEIYSDVPVFKAFVKGRFALEDLRQKAENDLIPDHVRKSLVGFGHFSGNLEADFEAVYKKGLKNPELRKGDFRFKDCLITHEKAFMPVTLKDAVLKIREGYNCDISAKGLAGESEFDISGSTQNILSRADMNLKIRMDINDLLARHFKKVNAVSVKFRSPLYSSFSLNKKGETWSFYGEVDMEGFGMENSFFAMEPPEGTNRAVFDLDFIPGKRLDLKNLSVNFGDSLFRFSGSYDLKDMDSLNFKVFSEYILLEDLGIVYKAGDIGAAGSLACRAEVDVSLRNPLKTQVNGEISSKNVSCFLSEIPSQINELDFRIRFGGKDVLIDSFKMLVGSSPVGVSGNLRGWEGIKGSLNVNSEFINVADLKKNGVDRVFSEVKEGCHAGETAEDSISSQWLKEFITKSEINILLNADRVQYRTLIFGPLEADCVFRSGNIFIKNSVFKKDECVLNLKGHLLTGRNPEMLFSGYVKLIGQPVNEYLQLTGISGFFNGTIDMEGVFYAKGRDGKEMLSSLTGSASFLIEKGRIGRSNIVLKVLESLSLQNVFIDRPAGDSEKGFDFSSISGDALIDNGIAESNNIIIRSPALNGVLKGILDISNSHIDFDIGVQPLGTIDSLISRIPVVGYVITGKERSILVYYFRATGKLSSPDVRYVPLKNWGSGLLGFFERLLLTPSRLIKGFSNGK